MFAYGMMWELCVYTCGLGLGFLLWGQAASVFCGHDFGVRGGKLYVGVLIVWESKVFF